MANPLREIEDFAEQAVRIVLIGLVVGCFLLVVTGCSTFRTIEETGSGVADGALESAEAVMCRAATVGSVVRRYGQSQAQADAWREICLGDGKAKVIGP